MVDVADVARENLERHLVDVDRLSAFVEVLVPDVHLARDSGEGDAFEALAHGCDLYLVVIKYHNEFLKGPDKNFTILVPCDYKMLKSMIRVKTWLSLFYNDISRGSLLIELIFVISQN